MWYAHEELKMGRVSRSCVLGPFLASLSSPNQDSVSCAG